MKKVRSRGPLSPPVRWQLPRSGDMRERAGRALFGFGNGGIVDSFQE